jgi:hypothetical protein
LTKGNAGCTGSILPERAKKGVRMKMVRTILLLCTAIVASLSISGCGEEDLTSVKLAIEASGKGKIVSTVIRVEDVKDDPIKKATSGADWKKRRVSVVVQEATFDDISKVQIADIRLSVSGNLFRLTIPLGKSARWTGILAASDKDAKVINKLGKEQGLAIPGKVGAKFKFTVCLPGKVIAKGFSPKIAEESSGGLLSFGSEGTQNEATLVIPLKKVRESTEKELVWEVTWKQ